MDCKHVRQKLSAYLDNELPAETRRFIASHLAECGTCAGELHLMQHQQRLLVESARPIAPSPHFRMQFWQKARALERGATRQPSFAERLFLRWIPVPVVLSLLITGFSTFSAVAPRVYGTDARIDGSIVVSALGSLTGQRSAFAPANFARFCDRCYEKLCEACLLVDC